MEEYLQIFNNDKKMLKTKIKRNEKNKLKDGENFMIILVFIENDNHEFLIQKTSINRDSVFATTGGHVSFKDNNIKTVIKETKEELGIDLEEDEIKYISTIKYPCCFCDSFYVHKNIDIKDIKIQKEEVDYVKWMSVEEIKKLINENKFRKGNIPQFYAILDYLRRIYE